MDKFEQYKLNFGDKQKDLINKYLEKTKNFVEKHSIDKELYNDIEEMVFEKLSLEKDINDLKIIKILKDVGEPEIIFADYVENNTFVEDSEIFYSKLQKVGWLRDNDGAIFLGISKVLALKIGINIIAIRILLLVLFFPLGISAWFYILAGIVLPVKGVNYYGKSTFEYFKTQIILAIRNGVYNLTTSFGKLIGITTSKGFSASIILFGYIIPFFRFIIFLGLGLFLSFWLFGFITIGSLYFTNFSVGNIDIVGILPNYFIHFVGAGVIGLSIFATFCFLYSINKNKINGYILSIGGISLLIAIFLGISTGFNLVQRYSVSNEFIQTAQIEVENSGNYLIDLGNLPNNDKFRIGIFYRANPIKLINSTGNTLKMEVRNIIYGDNEIYKSFTSSISNISLSKTDNNAYLSNYDNIKLNLENNLLFSKKTLLPFYYTEIILYIPEGVKIRVLDNFLFGYTNTFMRDIFKKYKEDSGYCSEYVREIFFSKEQNKFICNLDEDDLKEAKQEYLEQYISLNSDEIIPLKHKKDLGYKQWHIRDDNWDINDKNKIFVRFGDDRIEMDTSLKIENTSSGVVISDFKINNVSVNQSQFDRKYYVDTSIIDEYLDK